MPAAVGVSFYTSFPPSVPVPRPEITGCRNDGCAQRAASRRSVARHEPSVVGLFSRVIRISPRHLRCLLFFSLPWENRSRRSAGVALVCDDQVFHESYHREQVIALILLVYYGVSVAKWRTRENQG